MEKQLLGFLLLVLGIGAIFGIWVIALRDRSKPVEMAEPERPAERPVSRAGTTPYSLAPPARTEPTAQAAEPQPRLATVSAGEAPSSAPAELPVGKADDELARTHLEIAQQFFNQGDFEGAVEMCCLVAENPDASPGQVALAKHLQMECE